MINRRFLSHYYKCTKLTFDWCHDFWCFLYKITTVLLSTSNLIIIIDFSAASSKRLWDFHFIYEYIMKIRNYDTIWYDLLIVAWQRRWCQLLSWCWLVDYTAVLQKICLVKILYFIAIVCKLQSLVFYIVHSMLWHRSLVVTNSIEPLNEF